MRRVGVISKNFTSFRNTVGLRIKNVIVSDKRVVNDRYLVIVAYFE